MNIQQDIPRRQFRYLFTLLVIKSTKWDETTMEKIVVSFSLLEVAANTVFKRVDEMIDISVKKIKEIENVSLFIHR